MTANLVQLINGEFVTSDAAAWRDECLARHVLNLPTLAVRQAWLADYERRHGAAEAESLKYHMLQQKRSRKDQAPADVMAKLVAHVVRSGQFKGRS